MPSSSSSPSRPGKGRPPGQLVDGELLRRKRELVGFTREKLAELSGINSRTIARAERGHRLSEDSLSRLASALQMSAHEVIRHSTQEVQQRLARLGLAAPAPTGPWVARPTEAGRLVDCVTASPPRVCCIAGPSGIGKTALARHVAMRWRLAFPTGWCG